MRLLPFGSGNDRTDVLTDRNASNSDGLGITDVVVRPRVVQGRLPVILWCRGRLGAIGGTTFGDLLVIRKWARAGYVVIGSNYRAARAARAEIKMAART